HIFADTARGHCVWVPTFAGTTENVASEVRTRSNMSMLHARIPLHVLSTLAACVLAATATSASAQNCPAGMRKINVGVSVTPPNAVQPTTDVAKALGLFAKHCIDASILQFDGGQSPAALAAVNQGTAIANVTDVAIGRGSRAQQIWGFAARMPQSYTVSE